MMNEVLLGLATLALAHGAPQRNSLSFDKRIIGGNTVHIQEFPYQASMNYYNSHICGAVNIAPFFMLTAAQCIMGISVSYSNVRVGSSFHATGGLNVPIERFFAHPQYNPVTTDYDIAIIKLAVGLGSGVGVSAIALPYMDEEFQDETVAVVSGWGYISEGAGSIPDELQAVSVPIVGLDECRKVYPGVTLRMLCAGVPQGGSDACSGDFGGPLVIEGLVLAGLASWGNGCGRVDSPGVYSNVAALRDFIKEVANI